MGSLGPCSALGWKDNNFHGEEEIKFFPDINQEIKRDWVLRAFAHAAGSLGERANVISILLFAVGVAQGPQ